MKNLINKIKLYITAHKIFSVIILLVILLLGNWIYGKVTSTTGETRYVLSKVTRGTITSSVTGSGQVSALNQIDIKPNVSEKITYVGVQPGDKVTSGKLLFSLDDTNAKKTVRDAEASLESAKIAFEKFKVQNSNINVNANLAKVYDNGFSSVLNSFLDLPDIMSGFNDMFFKSMPNNNNGQWAVDWYEAQVSSDDVENVKPYKKNFVDSYNIALKAYTDNYNSYKTISRTSDNTTIEGLVSQTYETVKLISSAIKNANSYIDFVNTSIQKNNTRTSPALITSNKTTLSNYASQTNSHLADLLSAETNIQGTKDTVVNNSLDSQSQQLSVTQKENALQDAKDNLSYYYIRAPFGGTIASVLVQKGDNASSGTVLGTIITTQQIANISLNEVDVAKIKLGQKATLTFDAVSDLTITGKVAQIDSIGTVSQGVVNYNIKISFDTNDERIKPGMSVSAAIITGTKEDVLTVPNGAIKNQGNFNYVEIFNTPLPAPITRSQGSLSLVPPRRQEIVIGISNDTSTEVVSGLKEGDEIVTKVILPTSATATAPSIFGSVTNRGGSNTTRIPTTGR